MQIVKDTIIIWLEKYLTKLKIGVVYFQVGCRLSLWQNFAQGKEFYFILQYIRKYFLRSLYNHLFWNEEKFGGIFSNLLNRLVLLRKISSVYNYFETICVWYIAVYFIIWCGIKKLNEHILELFHMFKMNIPFIYCGIDWNIVDLRLNRFSDTYSRDNS